MLNIKLPTNEPEFQAMMEHVDHYLRKQGTPPHARPLKGWLHVSGSLRLGLRISPGQDREPREGSYTGDDLTIRIFRWFDLRYGDKLKVHPGPGRVFVIIRHDPWIITFPKVYGTVEFIISPLVPFSRPEVYLKNRAVPRYNVIESVQGMPSGLTASLQPQELREILEGFIAGYVDMSALDEVEAIPMVKEAKSDLEASVHHATSHPPHFGQVKWSSLQAAEKLLKAYLASSGKVFPKIHKLYDLAQIAEEAGLPPIDASWLQSVQCTAGIRYGEGPTSLVEAWSAHWSAVRVCGHVARAIKKA